MTLLALNEVSFQQSSTSNDLFKQLNFTVSAGECHCICGVTGIGKSTLLQLMAMPNDYEYLGQIIHSQDLRLGLVMQDPNVQLIRESIGAEVAFGLENLAYSPAKMLPLVEEALKAVGLDLPFDTSVSHLSLGQKYRLMLAAQLVLSPNLIFIDEPWAQLDNAGVIELNHALKRLLDIGVSVVITEHHSEAFAGVINTRWLLESGTLHKQESLPLSSAKTTSDLSHGSRSDCFDDVCLTATNYTDETAPNTGSNTDEICLTVFPLTIQLEDAEPLLEVNQTLYLKAGEVVGLFGENGCGKSSLLNQFVGIDDSNKADILMLGKTPKLGRFGKELGFLMQRPSRQLFELTVRQELEFSLKRYDLPLSSASEILKSLEITHLVELSPHKLSYGQQLLVALASVLCVKPKVLLLDVPFAGLDSQYFANVIDALTEFTRQGDAIIITSHRPVLEGMINKCWLVNNKQLHEKTCNHPSFACPNKNLQLDVIQRANL